MRLSVPSIGSTRRPLSQYCVCVECNPHPGMQRLFIVERLLFNFDVKTMSSNSSTSKEYPLLSIGVPTYTGAKRPHKAMHSIWTSGYPNLEVIICDNSTTANTQQI